MGEDRPTPSPRPMHPQTICPLRYVLAPPPRLVLSPLVTAPPPANQPALNPIRDPLRHVRSPPSLLSSPPSSSLLRPPPLSIPPPVLPSPTISSSAPRTIHPRRPQHGRTIAKNSLRPHVAAANRIYAWRTPYGDRERADVEAELPGSLAAQALLAVRGGLAQNSASTYAAGPLRFTQFCDTHGISEEARMPASHRLVSAFVSQHIAKVGGGTVNSWLSGLRAWHLYNNAPWVGDHYWVKQCLDCPRAGPGPGRPGVDPGPALRVRGQGQLNCTLTRPSQGQGQRLSGPALRVGPGSTRGQPSYYVPEIIILGLV